MPKMCKRKNLCAKNREDRRRCKAAALLREVRVFVYDDGAAEFYAIFAKGEGRV